MNRVHWLRQHEIEQLRELHHQATEPHLRNRCEMILLSNNGLTPPQIAQRLGGSRRTITRYIQRYEAHRLAGLYDKPKPGRPRRVTDEYLEKLQATVVQDPRLLGQPYSHWTTENLARYLEEQTGICLCSRQVAKYLKSNR